MKKNKAIWISYDLGLKGDYAGLYAWLDNHQAVECGNGLAFIQYATEKTDEDSLIAELADVIKQEINLAKNDRIYIIWKDSSTGKMKGEFVTGGRKQAPWVGYGTKNSLKIVDVAE